MEYLEVDNTFTENYLSFTEYSLREAVKFALEEIDEYFTD